MSKRARADGPQQMVVRVLMIGDSGVGKTSLVLRYDDNTFSHKFVTTIGVDYRDKMVSIDGQTVKLQIWDTAGQERFRSLTANFFSRADGIILTFDVTDRTSFEHVRKWMDEIQANAPNDVNVVLCGSKCDVEPAARQISSDEGKQLAESFGVPYFEASAKKNICVEPMFISLATTIAKRKEEPGVAETVHVSRGPSVDGQAGDKKPTSGCC